MGRGCRRHHITLHAVLKKIPPKKVRKAQSVTSGHRHAGESLLSDSDMDDVTFEGAEIKDTAKIQVTEPVSEALFSAIQIRMSRSFEEGDEVPGTQITTDFVRGKVTRAGIFATMFTGSGCFNLERKFFIPWSSVVSLKYRHATCLNKASLDIQNRSESLVHLKNVSFDSFQVLKEVFAEVTSEVAAEEGDQVPDVLVGGAKGLDIQSNGVHCNKGCCCCKVATFTPWARIDGLLFENTTVGGKVSIVSEMGEVQQIARTTTNTAWSIYDAVLKMKYASSSDDALIFNPVKDARRSCKLTDHSVKVSLHKGKLVKEVDLERVVGARRGQRSHTELEIAVSLSKGETFEVIKVPLNETENARVLATAICEKVARRKEILSQMYAVASSPYRPDMSSDDVGCSRLFNFGV